MIELLCVPFPYRNIGSGLSIVDADSLMFWCHEHRRGTMKWRRCMSHPYFPARKIDSRGYSLISVIVCLRIGVVIYCSFHWSSTCTTMLSRPKTVERVATTNFGALTLFNVYELMFVVIRRRDLFRHIRKYSFDVVDELHSMYVTTLVKWEGLFVLIGLRDDDDCSLAELQRYSSL